MLKIKEVMNARQVGWGYDEKGQLMLLVPTFSNTEDPCRLKMIDDCRIEAYLKLLFEYEMENYDKFESFEEWSTAYDNFVRDEMWTHDIDVYKVVGNKLIDTDAYYEFKSNEKLPTLKLSDEACGKAMRFIQDGLLLDNEKNTEVKVGDIRYCVDRDEIVLVMPAPNYMYHCKNDEPNSLSIILSLSGNELVTFKNERGYEFIVLDEKTINSDLVKNTYPYLITRNLSDLIK